MCDKESQAAPAPFHPGRGEALSRYRLPTARLDSWRFGPMQQNRPVVIAVAVILLLAVFAFWRSCSL
jgi:hypothetical protein